MAKDPAVLLYTQDFIVGTITMTYEQKGKYIYLLCLQHQKGKLTDKDLKLVLDDTDVDVFQKFIKDADGYYYNIRLKEEADKRKKYTESRRNNRKGKTNEVDKIDISKSYVKLMENENEDVNVIDNVNDNLLQDKAYRQDMLAEALTGSLDREQKELMNKFKNTFGV